MIKLILTDIDDTIKPMDSPAVPQEAIDAFRAAEAAGIVVGPASARGYAWILDYFAGSEDCCSTILATNGSEVYLEGERIFAARLAAEDLEEVRSYVAGVPRAGLLVFDNESTPLLVEGALEDLEVAFPAYARASRPVDGIPGFDIVKAGVFIAEDREGTWAFVDELNERFDVFDFDYPKPGWSNIMPAGWNKGAAIRFLAERIGASLDEVVIFGDAGNDIPMFEVVPNSVAVANATPAAAAAARWHIGPCEDHAVATAIQELARGAWPFVE